MLEHLHFSKALSFSLTTRESIHALIEKVFSGLSTVVYIQHIIKSFSITFYKILRTFVHRAEADVAKVMSFSTRALEKLVVGSQTD